MLGGKAAGAGAGGSMFFLMKNDAHAAADTVTASGARVLPFSWAADGLKTW
jgi:mevalonate kinase